MSYIKFNWVELSSDEPHQSPCVHGNIVDGYACYCHSEDDDAPRKCPIWRNFGEHDLSKWHKNGDFNLDNWDGGCKWFIPSKI